MLYFTLVLLFIYDAYFFFFFNMRNEEAQLCMSKYLIFGKAIRFVLVLEYLITLQ